MNRAIRTPIPTVSRMGVIHFAPWKGPENRVANQKPKTITATKIAISTAIASPPRTMW